MLSASTAWSNVKLLALNNNLRPTDSQRTSNYDANNCTSRRHSHTITHTHTHGNPMCVAHTSGRQKIADHFAPNARECVYVCVCVNGVLAMEMNNTARSERFRLVHFRVCAQLAAVKRK